MDKDKNLALQALGICRIPRHNFTPKNLRIVQNTKLCVLAIH